MISTSAGFLSAIKAPARYIDAYIKIGSKTYKPRTFRIEQKIYSSDTESFIGTFIAKSGTVQVDPFDNLDLENTWLEIFEGVKVSGAFEYISLGTYLVYEKNKNHEYCIIDKRVLFNVEAPVDKITYPTTPLVLAQWVCSKVGVALDNASFPNCDLVIPKAISFGLAPTFADIVQAIAQASCSFAAITSEGKLAFRWFEPVDFKIQLENMSSVPVVSGAFGPINSVVLSRDPLNDNVYINDDQSIIDNGLTALNISNNPILDIDRHTSKLAIFNLINGFTYVPVKVKSQGMFHLEAGDVVQRQLNDGNYIDLYVMDHTIDYRGSSASTFETPAMTKTQIDYAKAESTRQMLKNTEAMVDKQNQIIRLQVSEVTEKVETIEATKRYKIQVSSSMGTAFRNGQTATTLSVNVYSWDEDVTGSIEDASLVWECRIGGSLSWTKTGKQIVLGDKAFAASATISCSWSGIRDALSLVNVYDGTSGAPGKDGLDGKDGATTYFHVKYASVINPTDAQIKEEPDKYIGTYVDYLSTDSTHATDYKWSKHTGDDGVPGVNGANGQTSYLHIKYSNDGGKTFTANNGETPGDYLGQYTDFVKNDSALLSDYAWSKIKGEIGVTGAKGVDGKQLYTWLKYADSPTSGMSESPTDKAYIGLAYNKESSTESSAYADYTWSLIKGSKGDQGVPGAKGADGKQLYTWIKYAMDNKGTGLSDDPTGKLYIGLAYNKTTEIESAVASDYTWSLIKGDKGEQGDRGLQGLQGPKGDQGVPGAKGADGVSTYFHIKYAPVQSPTAAQMSETPNVFIGTYVDDTSADSTDPSKYVWARFQGLQGTQGTQGIPGVNGANGQTSYLHIKYSNDGGKTFTANTGETPGDYIGVYTDNNINDSTAVSAYTWSLIKGEPGTNGIGVSKVETFYYLSTSNTTQTGGSWVAASPAWTDGKYIWQKTKTTLTNSTSTESAPICVTGGKGGTGATGKGVSSISAEYYLSTSKTTQAGGSWITTSPVWSIGKYVWTRSKVVYTDGSTTYTIPLCDSSWEAINDIEIGGRNLLLKSGSLVSNSTYNIASYSLGDIKPKEGDECTITIKGALGDGKTYFGCYNSGGNISMVGIYPTDFKDGIASKTFTWRITVGSVVAANTQLTVYAMPSTATTASTIDWIRLDFGNKAPRIWTPAPEDISNEIDDSETRITETYKALIDVTKKEIDLSVESITTKVNNTEEQVSGLQNQLEITNEVTSFIKTTTESLKTIVDGKADITTIEEWARFNGSSLELGASNSPFKAILSNTELAFWQGNTKVAWISNNELHIANSVIMEILKVGNWQCRDEGGAGLTWRRV